MSSAGGGGVNLPPIVQPIQVSVSGNGAATAQFGRIMSSASGASGALGGVTNATRTMNQQVMRTLPTWRTAGDAIRQAGSLMKYTVAMPLLEIGRASLQAASQFEKSMAMITGLVGIPAAEVKKMSQEVLNMAGDVGKTPVELAEALYFITSAGVKGAKAMDTLDASARAAAAGLGTTNSVADVVTSVMNAYPDGLYSATLATDILVAAVREGKAEASSFAPAMGKVLPVAAAFGLKFQDVAASMAALTRFGKPAGTAAIELRQIMASLLKPTQEARETLEGYGLSAATLRDTIVNKGFFAGLQQLKGALGENAEAYARVFGNVRPLTAITALLGPSMERNADIFRKLSAAAGDSAEAFEAVQQTASQKWAETSAVLQASMIDIGNGLAPMSKALADLGKVLATALGGLARIPGITKFIAGFAGMAVVVSLMTRTLSTWIRMRYLTTVALQALTGGMRDTQTQMVNNIVTGQSYSYAQQQQAVATTRAGAAAAGAVAPNRGLGATMQQLSAVLNQLMVVMTENSIITAESTAFNRALAISQGNVVTSTQAMTNSVLAGDTALARHAATSAASASASGSAATGMGTVAGAATGATAATSAFTSATGVVVSSSTAAASATSAATAATTAHTAATGLGVAGQLQVNQTLMQKIFLLGLDAKGLNLATAFTGKFAIAQIYAAGATTLLGGALKKLLLTMGPMMLLTVGLGLLMSKFLSRGAEETKEKITGAADAIRGLEDQASNFNPAPLVVGVDVRYKYSGGTGTGSGDSAMDFGNFLFPGGTKGLDEDKQKILDEINSARTEIKTYAGKVNFGSAFASQFGDEKTRAAAVDYISGILNVDPSKIQAEVDSSVADVGKFVKGQLERYTGNVDLSEAYNSVFITSGLDPGFGPDAANVATEFSAQKFEKLVEDFPDLTQPFEDAVMSGSVPQFTESLREVYNAAVANGAKVEEAEKATVAYAKAAITSAGGTTKANTVMQLLAENAGMLGPNLLESMNEFVDADNKIDKTTLTTTGLIGAFDGLEVATEDATPALNNFDNAVESLTSQFKDGLNDYVQEAVNLMDAYAEAVKQVKRGQDALFGSQLNMIDAEVGFRDALRGTMDDLKDSNGVWDSGTAAADKTKKALADSAKALLDVGNAAYANGEGGAEAAAVRASAAVSDQFALMKRNFLAAGLKEEDFNAFFNDKLGSGVKIDGDFVRFDPKTIAQTFAKDINKAVTDVTTQINTTEIGTNFLDGIDAGIKAHSGVVGATAVEEMRKVISAVAAFLGIASPSKLAALQIGKPIAEGIAEGIRNETPVSIKAILGELKKIEDAAAAAATETPTTGTTSTTLPVTPKPIVETDKVTKSGMGVGQAYSQGIAQGVVSAQSAVIGAFNGVIYNVTQKYQGKSAANAKKMGYEWTNKYAEGIMNGRSAARTSIIDLVQAIMQEVADDLSTTTTTISAILDLSGAQNDLAKFKNSNSQAMLTAGVNQANRASANATAKFGGNQGTEVTRYERAQIADSRKSAQQAQRDFALGKISYAALLEAQQGYADTTAAAGEASKEVVDAQNNVLDANYQNTNSNILLAQEQMKVITAQQGLNTAYVNAKINSTDAATALTNLGTQAGITTTAIGGIVTSLTNVANMGLGAGMQALIPQAATQTTRGKITRVRWTPKESTKSGTRGGGGGGGGGDKKTELKAKGGPLAPGRLTLVGESGPEVIKSNSAGTVTPYSVLERYARTTAHNSMRGEYGDSGKSINITVNNPTPEPASDSIARRMQNMSALGLFA
jgi:TP901 family phage tail tape measure protein